MGEISRKWQGTFSASEKEAQEEAGIQESMAVQICRGSGEKPWALEKKDKHFALVRPAMYSLKLLKMQPPRSQGCRQGMGQGIEAAEGGGMGCLYSILLRRELDGV